MPVQSIIIDPTTKRPVGVSEQSFQTNGMVVAARPLYTWENRTTAFTSQEYGINMNVDFSVGGTPEEVHDGTDNSYWTGSNVAGSKGSFASTNRFNTGTKSIEWDAPSLNDIIQLAKGSDVTMSNYVGLTMYINIDKDWTTGDEIQVYWYDSAGSAQVGDAINLEDYITINLFDVWQKVTVPLSTFGAAANSSVVDSLRLEYVSKDGKAPKIYLDDIQIEETGNIGEFVVAPSKGKIMEASEIRISMAKAYDPDSTDNTLPKLAYDTFLGNAALTSGLVYRREDHSGVLATATVNDPMDILQVPGASVQAGSDGTNTWATYISEFGEPLVLNDALGDKISYTISEDLSGFLFFRVFLKGRERDI